MYMNWSLDISDKA